MMVDGSLLRSGGETWEPVSQDNVHETGVSPGEHLDPHAWPPETEQVERTRGNLVTGPIRGSYALQAVSTAHATCRAETRGPPAAWGEQEARFPRRRPSPCDYLRSSSRPSHTHRLLRSRRLTAILRPPPGSVKAPRPRSRDTWVGLRTRNIIFGSRGWSATMKPPSQPNSDYTRTWSPPGVIEYATLADGSRLRYLKTGYGPTPLILLHTVRTQLDHFQLVIPRLLHAFTVYAIDMPGMGWSDIVPGASYTEPALRRALVQFVTALDLVGLTLSGESMGATVSLTASIELEDRVRSVVAFNPYDYAQGVARANRVASIYIGGARLPGIGPIVARTENKPVLGIVLKGGLFDGRKLPDHYLGELRRVGRRRGYPRVAREVFSNVESMLAARSLYARVPAPVYPHLRGSRLVACAGARSQSRGVRGRGMDHPSGHRPLRRSGTAGSRR